MQTAWFQSGMVQKDAAAPRSLNPRTTPTNRFRREERKAHSLLLYASMSQW